jgi:hypothetical protein
MLHETISFYVRCRKGRTARLVQVGREVTAKLTSLLDSHDALRQEYQFVIMSLLATVNHFPSRSYSSPFATL